MWFHIAGKEGYDRQRVVEIYEKRLPELLHDVISLQSEGNKILLLNLLDSLTQINFLNQVDISKYLCNINLMYINIFDIYFLFLFR